MNCRDSLRMIALCWASASLTGCADINDDLAWLTAALAAFLLFLLGCGAYVGLRRLSQLRAWDLASSVSAPSVKPLVLKVVLIAVLVILLGGVGVFLLDSTTGQRLLVLLGLVAGVGIGAYVGILAGRHGAESSYVKQ